MSPLGNNPINRSPFYVFNMDSSAGRTKSTAAETNKTTSLTVCVYVRPPRYSYATIDTATEVST